MEHYFTNNEDLKSELRCIKYDYESYSFIFGSDLGVFSKNKIDYGSRFLLEEFLKLKKDEKDKTLLDVGCGYGYLGIVVAKYLAFQVDMIDINKRAIHLTNENIKSNKVFAKAFESNMYENVSNHYDFIITNPPIRAGKEIYLNILQRAKDYLNETGELWFVMHKDHGVKSVIKELENVYLCQITNKNKGFFVVMAKKR